MYLINYCKFSYFGNMNVTSLYNLLQTVKHTLFNVKIRIHKPKLHGA